MNRNWTAFAMLAALGGSAACGGIAVIDPDNGQGGSGGSATTSSTTSSTTSGGGGMDVSLVDAIARANCQPSVPPDPMVLSFSLRFDNSAGSSASEAIIDSAEVSSGVLGTTFKVSPDTSGSVAAGTTSDVDFEKVANSAVGDSACSYCSSVDIRLQVSLTIGGQAVEVDDTIDSISCVF
jgi:hypothetical protein